jgi:hypothetical protein
LLLFGAAAQAGVIGPGDKLTDDEKIELLRGLMSEYATMKVPLARSKKPLEFFVEGTFNRQYWENSAKQMGPAARPGDIVQLTKVTFQGDRLLFDINGGLTSGRHWYDNIQGGMGGVGGTSGPSGPGGPSAPGGQVPQDAQLPNGPSGTPTSGTYLLVIFRKPMENLSSAQIKKMLAPIMDFNQRSAAQLYSETVSPEMQKAIKDKVVAVGMSRDEVKTILGQPDYPKQRETTKDGIETEDWIYGKPPGKMTFVTFAGSKVIKVKDEYAGLGSDTVQR